MLAIYYNTKMWGGVDVLIARFAAYLQKKEIKFCIITDQPKALRQHLGGVKFVSHNSVDEIAEEVTHVFLATTSYLFTPEFPWSAFANVILYTWVVHPTAPFRQSFPFSGHLLDFFGYRGVPLLRTALRSHASAVHDLFSLLAARGSIAVMDGATLRSLNYFFPSLPAAPALIPVPSPISGQTNGAFGNRGDISTGYLGRLDVFKWSAVAPFLSSVATIAKNRPVRLHVVAEGDHIDKLKSLCEKLSIDLRFHGFMSNESARVLIKNSTHFAFAMGTSALDIAGSAHPCLVVDPALGRGVAPQRLFRFIHEAQDFTLGEFRDAPGYVPGIRTLAQSIQLVTQGDLGCAARDYVEKHHDPSKCFDILLSCIFNGQATVWETGRAVSIIRKSFWKIKTFGGYLRSAQLHG